MPRRLRPGRLILVGRRGRDPVVLIPVCLLGSALLCERQSLSSPARSPQAAGRAAVANITKYINLLFL